MKRLFNTYYIILFTVISIWITPDVQGQSYPIQVSTMVSPPYSMRLSDYVESGYERIQVTINPLDVNLVAYGIKLKLVIESFDGRIRIETNPGYLPAPIFLNGGVPEILGSYDVQHLFNINHLIFYGYSKNQYLATGKLPEGYYRIGFEAVDYNRASAGTDLQVSNYGFSMAGMFLNDPPLLNIPQNREKIQIFQPQHILFQWTPRHKGSPNSAFSTEYIFRLYEVWNEYNDPNIISNTQLPIFETVTTSSQLPYGIAEPVLIPGKKYVWTVQAQETENRNLFRNNGYSEAYIFQYGDECKVPANMKLEAVKGPGMEIEWEGYQGHTDYIIQYRIAGSNSNWYEESSLLDNSRIYDLKYKETYEVQVKAQCGSFESEYTQIAEVTMPEEPLQNFACGGAGILEKITNKSPLEHLSQGSTFMAGGFECKVQEATGSAGTFSGKCLVIVPFYGYARVLHTFENIKINTDMVMYSGKLVAVKDSVKNAKFMTALEDVVPDKQDEYTKEYLALVFGAQEIVTLDKEAETLVINENGDIEVTYTDGSTEIIDVDDDNAVIVEDSKGNQYLVQNGQVNEITPELVASAQAAGSNVASTQVSGNVDSVIAALPLIRFAPSSDMVFGYDSLKYQELKNQYITETIKETDYVIPYKAIATGQVDYVEALLPESDNYNRESVSFKTNDIPVTASETTDGTHKKLNVTALVSGDIQPLEAIYNLKDTSGNSYQETLGKLNIIAYDKQILKLYLVPVNSDGSNYNTAVIKNYINNVYSQAVTEWDVVMHEPLNTDEWDINEDGIFDNTDNDDRMDYTPAMKKVYKEFNRQFDTDKDAVYAFLIDKKCTDRSLQGYMPFKKQYAFIFEDNLGSKPVTQVISHEIAHGAFNLRHTFSNKNLYVQSEGTTQNLMDYVDGNNTELYKYQWDLIHDPESMVFTWLQDEEEGEGGINYSVSYALVIMEGNKSEEDFEELELNINNWSEINEEKILYIECYGKEEEQKIINATDYGSIRTEKIQKDIFFFGEDISLTIFSVEVKRKGDFKLTNTNWNGEIKSPYLVINTKQSVKVRWTDEIFPVSDGNNVMSSNKSLSKTMNYEVIINCVKSMPQFYYYVSIEGTTDIEKILNEKLNIYGSNQISLECHLRNLEYYLKYKDSKSDHISYDESSELTNTFIKSINTSSTIYKDDLYSTKSYKFQGSDNKIIIEVNPIFGEKKTIEVFRLNAPIIVAERGELINAYGLESYYIYKDYDSKLNKWIDSKYDQETQISSEIYYVPIIKLTSSTPEEIPLNFVAYNTPKVDGLCRYQIFSSKAGVEKELQAFILNSEVEKRIIVREFKDAEYLLIKDATGNLKGKLKIKSEKLENREVYVFFLNINGKVLPSTNSNSIEEGLRVYEQIGIKWKAYIQSTINIDINDVPSEIQGYFKGTSTKTVPSYDEQMYKQKIGELINKKVLNKPEINKYADEYKVFIVPNRLFKTGGWAGYGKKYCIMAGNSDGDLISHELGHNFGLKHIAVEWDVCTDNEISKGECPIQEKNTNVMGYSGNLIDFYEWQKMIINQSK